MTGVQTCALPISALTGCLSAIPGFILTRRENCGAKAIPQLKRGPRRTQGRAPAGQDTGGPSINRGVPCAQAPAASKALPLHPPPRRQRATLPAHLRLAWRHEGRDAQEPPSWPLGLSWGPLFTPAPSATHQRLPGLAAANGSLSLLSGFGVTQAPLRLGRLPPVTCGRIPTPTSGAKRLLCFKGNHPPPLSR